MIPWTSAQVATLVFVMSILISAVVAHMSETDKAEVSRPLIGGSNASEWNKYARSATELMTIIAVVTLGLCYILWLSAGCKAFLPFISDLGLDGAMRFVFPCGAVLISALMAYIFYHIHIARHALCSKMQLPALYRGVNLIGSAGLISAASGVGAIGFYPWSTDLAEHFACVYLIFYGGFVWSIASAVLSRQISIKEKGELPDWAAYGTRWLQAPLALLSVCSWIIMLWCFFQAQEAHTSSSSKSVETSLWSASPSVNSLLRSWQPYGPGIEFLQQRPSNELRELLHLAATNFPRYCRGSEGTWHDNEWVNAAALMEWTLIGSLLGTVIVCLPDLDVYALKS